MSTLDKVCAEWGLSLNGQPSPIEVPGISREKELPELFNALGLKRGAEVGVEQGVYSETLCQLIPDLKLVAVDCWTAHKGYRDHVSQSKLDGFEQAARARLKPHGVRVVKGWSVEVSRMFADGFFDFVYIDANHDFANVVADIAAWSPKVRKGGIVAGHDFRRRKNPIAHYVVEAVSAWTACHKIAPWFVLGRRERREGEPRDKNRSWMWVR